MPKLPQALEIEYLRYFFDQVNLTVSERYFLEEGFELCFQKSVPSALKMRSSLNAPIIPADAKTPKLPPPPSIPDIHKLLNDVHSEDYILVDKNTGENMSLSMLINRLKLLAESK